MFEMLENKKHLDENFASWLTDTKIIDDKRAIYTLYNPESSIEFVSMFVDGNRAFFYGDYNSLIFDFTWNAKPDNIPYGSMDYLMEKLSMQSTEYMTHWDETRCRNDIIKTLKNNIENDVDEKIQNIITNTLFDKNTLYYTEDDFDDIWNDIISELKEKLSDEEYDDIEYMLDDSMADKETLCDKCRTAFSISCHTDDVRTYETSAAEFSDYDDGYRNCGYYIAQQVYINLYAMYTFAQKEKSKGE